MRTAIVKSLLSVIMIAVGCQLVAPVPAQAAERKTISVYVSDENLPKVTDEHLKMIDRLIVHFGRISADGRLKLDALPHLKQAVTLQRIHAVNPRISLILSIGGGNDAARSEFDAMVRKASTPACLCELCQGGAAHSSVRRGGYRLGVSKGEPAG